MRGMTRAVHRGMELVQVAWAEGQVSEAERVTVLEIAEARGLERSSPAHARLVEWLERRPSDALFDAAAEVLRLGYSVLPTAEREERIKDTVEACRKVARSAEGKSLVS